MRKKLDSSKYLELPHSRAYQRHRFEEIQHGRTFVDRHYYRVLMEAMVHDLYEPEQIGLSIRKSQFPQNHLSRFLCQIALHRK